jgi:predicted HD phosphohydrolase
MLTDQKGLALGCQVDLFEHALQTATRCYNDVIARTKAETPEQKAALTPAGLTVDDEELVVVALLHDIGETLSPINHGEVAAGILRPFISPRNYWILMHHEIFQLYYYGEAAGALGSGPSGMRGSQCRGA